MNGTMGETVTDRFEVRILVTGARTTTPENDQYVASVLRFIAAPILAGGGQVVVVEGRCPKGGVDRAAQKWAEATPGVVDKPYPADWSTHGKAAGMIRNAEMVAAGADICLAFPGPDSVGTWDCLKKAAAAGIIGRVYPLR